MAELRSDHGRQEDLPIYLKWAMTFINRVGFPIVVCAWMAYQQFVQQRETVESLHGLKEVLISVKDTLDQQNRILRHKSRDD